MQNILPPFQATSGQLIGNSQPCPWNRISVIVVVSEKHRPIIGVPISPAATKACDSAIGKWHHLLSQKEGRNHNDSQF